MKTPMLVELFIMVITLNLWNVLAPNGCGRAGLMLPGWRIQTD
jgi:hypothetical protein